MSKYEDFVFIAPAKQKIVSTVGSQPYRTISLYPYCNNQLHFITKEIVKCPVCNKLVKRPLGH